jgi:endonuclease/exonuclease/phosphatase family metal-dependent hydrolase
MIIKKVISGTIGISIIATSVALIGAAAAPHVDPSDFDWPAFLGLMYPFLLLLHLVFFVCYFIINRNKRSLLFLIPVLVTVQLFLNSFGINYFSSNREVKGHTLKFMTYNVHMFREANNMDSSVQAQMLQLIKNEQPDVLTMQDFESTNGRNGGLSTTDSIKTILKAKYYYDGPNNLTVFPTRSIATVSRFPIVNTGYVLFSNNSGGNQAVFTDINRNGKIIRIYNVHFQSLGFQPYEYEEWKNADIMGKLGFLYKVKYKFSVAFSERSKQVKMVKKHASSCPYPFIIAGDFNDTPSSFAVNYTMREMKNAFREKAKGYTVTFNGGLPDFQIDYIMVKPSFKVLDYRVIHKKLSDHYPVVVTLGVE